MQQMYLILTIIKRSDSKDFLKFFHDKNAIPIYCSLCEGTTNSETLNILGIEKTEKLLIQSIVTASKLRQIIPALLSGMEIDLPDRGISIAIPMSSFASRHTLEHISNSQNDCGCSDTETYPEEGKGKMELIISIHCKGNTDAVMKLARSAGAKGGTFVKAKGTASPQTDKFFGMSITDEREILYIVASKDNRNEIMRAIASHIDENGAHPLVFSMPVTDSIGLRPADI